MSQEINTRLFERAADCIDYCSGAPDHMDEQIERAMGNNDLEVLAVLVAKVEAKKAQEEIEASDVY